MQGDQSRGYCSNDDNLYHSGNRRYGEYNKSDRHLGTGTELGKKVVVHFIHEVLSCSI